jgi:hypothetical protein
MKSSPKTNPSLPRVACGVTLISLAVGFGVPLDPNWNSLKVRLLMVQVMLPVSVPMFWGL